MLVEEFDLPLALLGALEDFCVRPPAEEADGVHVAQDGCVKAGGIGSCGEAFAGVATVVTEMFVDRAVEGHEGGHDQHGLATFWQYGREGFEGAEIVFDVFKDVEANDAVGGILPEVEEGGTHGIENERADIGIAGEAPLVFGDAGWLDVDTDDELATGNHTGKIADAAAYFDHTATERGKGELRLPFKIINGAGHALLVAEGVIAGRGYFAGDQSSILSQRRDGYTGLYPHMSSLLDRLKQGIQKTRSGLVGSLEDLIHGRKEIDPDLLEELEYSLIGSDIGVKTTTEILDSIRQRVERQQLSDAGELKSLIRRQLLDILEANERPMKWAAKPPTVVMIVGVNGVGKTTTIGKLAHRFKADGQSVLICAADTFRAAAIEQLEVWAQRSGVDMIRQQAGSDPSAVLYDALQAAQARNSTLVIVDTAGRLHNKAHLMAELEKMTRTARRIVPDSPHEVWLVLDATTGQNGLEQAKKFTESAGVTGIVLTKLDGTAKGGVVVAIAREMNLPIRFVGVGEQIEDLVPFEADKFVASLFDN